MNPTNFTSVPSNFSIPLVNMTESVVNGTNPLVNGTNPLVNGTIPLNNGTFSFWDYVPTSYLPSPSPLYTGFREKISWGATSLHSYVLGPFFDMVGDFTNKALSPDYQRQASSAISAVGFGYMALKGGAMVLTPLKPKEKNWYRFESRFESKMKLKGNLVNLSKLIGDIPSVPTSDQVSGLAKQTAEQAKSNVLAMQDIAKRSDTSYQTALGIATTAQAAADAAQTAATRAQRAAQHNPAIARAKTAADAANQRAIDAQTAADQAEQDSISAGESTLEVGILPDVAANRRNLALLARQHATQMRQEAVRARTEAQRLQALVPPLEAPANNLIAEAQRLQNEATRLRGEADQRKAQSDADKKSAEDAVKQEANAQKLANPAAPKAPEKDAKKDVKKDVKKDDLEGATHLLSYKLEKTKIKDGETHFRIPFSKDALVINHTELKRQFTRSAAGVVPLTIGSLGLIDSVYTGFDVDSNQLLGDGRLKQVAWAIGGAGQNISYVAAKLFGYAVNVNKIGYGVGNTLTAAGLAYLGYKTIQSTNLVWFNAKAEAYKICHIPIGLFAADPANPIVLRTTIIDEPFGTKYKWGTMPVVAKDFLKVAAGVTLMAGGLLSANELFSGNAV